jgi:thiol-disulfide isomerase/thioredoxin
VKARTLLLLTAATLLAGSLGLLASLALFGPGPLLRTPLGKTVLREWLRGAEHVPDGLVVVLPGDTVVPFALPELDGSIRRLPTPGRITLINYWASWCGPCREEMPVLADYAKRQGSNGVQVVGIALDDAVPARQFFGVGNYGFPSAVEAAGERDSSVRLGNTRGILPYSVLIGADGRLLDSHRGAFDDLEALEEWIAAAR